MFLFFEDECHQQHSLDANARALLAFGWDAFDHRSSHASASRRNDFSTQASAQGHAVSRMIVVLIITVQICKFLIASWIHAYVCCNSLRGWHIICTEWYGHVQDQNTQCIQRKTKAVLMVTVLKRVWHRSRATRSVHCQRWLRRDVKQCRNALNKCRSDFGHFEIWTLWT